MPCQKCKENPSSHSFHHLGQTKNGCEIIYTCPAKTIGFDGSDPKFVEYFDEHLRIIHGKPWVWIFDCQEFKLEYMLSISNLRQLVNYLNENHTNYLQKSYILHAGWAFSQMMVLTKPLLKKETQKKIHIMPENSLDLLNHLEKQGFFIHQLRSFLKSSS